MLGKGNTDENIYLFHAIICINEYNNNNNNNNNNISLFPPVRRVTEYNTYNVNAKSDRT